MGEVRVSLTNFIAIGLMAFVFIFLANRALGAAGFGAWRV